MEWWRILFGGILEIGATLFFVLYLFQRSSSEVNIGNTQENKWLSRQQSHLQNGGCLTRILVILFSPAIAVTIFIAYVPLAMFLFIPLHPFPDNNFGQFVISGLILTTIIFPPIFILVIMSTVVAARNQQINVPIYFVKILIQSLLFLIFVEIIVWFGIHT
jgi:hypothetical protein